MSTVLHDSQPLALPRYIDNAFDFVEAIDLTAFTETQVATGDAVMRAAANGQVRITGAATTDNSGAQLQLATSAVQLIAGGYAFALGRFYLSSDNVEFLFGLCSVDTSLIASAPTDGIYLAKVEDVEDVKLVVRTNGSTNDLGVISTQGDAVWTTWVIEVKNVPGSATTAIITVWKDGKSVYTTPNAVTVPSAVLDLSIAAQSGSAVGTQYMDVDFLRVRARRA